MYIYVFKRIQFTINVTRQNGIILNFNFKIKMIKFNL